MNRIIEGARVVVIATTWTAIGIVVAAVAPFVSAVAIPIFAIRAAVQWNEHRPLYDRTLTNLTRETFGRVSGQDYTRWDGRDLHQANTNLTTTEKMHQAIGSYVHGSPRDPRFRNDREADDSPFRTEEDLEWLNREFTRREKKDLLDSDLKILRAFSKALIPIIGVVWVLFTELSVGGASEMGCRGCAMGGDAEDTHWGWEQAINFHRERLRNRLQELRRDEEIRARNAQAAENPPPASRTLTELFWGRFRSLVG